MDYPTVISKHAKADLSDIYSHLSIEANILIAERTVAQIKKKIKDIGIFPYGYKEFADVPKYRMVRAGRHLVFYTIDEERKVVHIRRILHAKRNLRKEL